MMFVMFGGRGEAHWIVSKSSKVPVDGSSEGTCPSGAHRATKTGFPRKSAVLSCPGFQLSKYGTFRKLGYLILGSS